MTEMVLGRFDHLGTHRQGWQSSSHPKIETDSNRRPLYSQVARQLDNKTFDMS